MSQYGHFNNHRSTTKAIQSLLGICRGLIADNHLNDDEIRFLSIWLLDNAEFTEAWPACVIRDRVAAVMQDGIITEDERADLMDTLKQLSGDEFIETGSAQTAPVSFPKDDTPIEHNGSAFCLTGKFIFGPRFSVERAIEQQGGLILGNVTKKTHYLIVGALSSPDWLHSSHGLKIQKAVELKESGCSISIISEHDWLETIRE